MSTVTKEFGTLVFNDAVMQERLPKEPLGSKCSAFSPLYRFQGS